MPIIADVKDWTWVLSRPCPECGFTAADTTPATLATTLPTLLPRWQAALRRAEVEVRPHDARWSVLEYAAHVRDVVAIFETRLALMLDHDNPTFPNWDQDRAALEGDYAAADPGDVAAELAQNIQDAAWAFGDVPATAWDRTGLRSNGSPFTVLSLSGYFLHDIIHHLHDIDA